MAFFGVGVEARRPSKLIENPQTIGEHIRKRRQELKITQKEVAGLIGVSEDTITYWENSRSVPQIQIYPKIIQFLGYNPFARGDKSIGGQMYRYRTEKGLSFRELAKLTGFDPSTLRSWERTVTIPNGKSKVKLRTFKIID